MTVSFTMVFSQSTQFIKYYGDICPDFGLSLDMTDDGGYILLGHTENFGAQYLDMFLLKIDSIGNVEWQELYGGFNLDFGQCIQITDDKGFILCGFTNSYGAGGYDIYIVKTDSLGNFEWQQTYGGTANEYGYSVKQTSDRGYILCGSTSSFGSGGTDAILIKTDSLGNQEWSNYYGTVNNDGAYSLDITSDSGYVLGGYSYGTSTDDAMIIKTDANGNQQWSMLYGGSSNDRALFIKQSSDKGFCFAGYTNSYGNGAEDMYFVKTDSLGNLIYYKTYGGSLVDKAFSFDFTSDNGYILTGQTNSFGYGNNDLYVVKADSLGNLVWHKFFGGTEDDAGFTIKATRDGGYIAIGNTLSFNIIWAHLYVVKMDSSGFATSIKLTENKRKQTIIYPNPTTGKITIKSDKMEQVEIFTVSGRLVYKQVVSNNMFDVDISTFNKGVYFIKVTADDAIGVERVVLQ